jgi:hypothetical protein
MKQNNLHTDPAHITRPVSTETRVKKRMLFNCKSSIARRYLAKKLSIDHIIKKLHEVDLLQFILFKNEELSLFKQLPNPISKDPKQEICGLWEQFEFAENRREIHPIDSNTEFAKKMNILCNR